MSVIPATAGWRALILSDGVSSGYELIDVAAWHHVGDGALMPIIASDGMCLPAIEGELCCVLGPSDTASDVEIEAMVAQRRKDRDRRRAEVRP